MRARTGSSLPSQPTFLLLMSSRDPCGFLKAGGPSRVVNVVSGLAGTPDQADSNTNLSIRRFPGLQPVQGSASRAHVGEGGAIPGDRSGRERLRSGVCSRRSEPAHPPIFGHPDQPGSANVCAARNGGPRHPLRVVTAPELVSFTVRYFDGHASRRAVFATRCGCGIRTAGYRPGADNS